MKSLNYSSKKKHDYIDYLMFQKSILKINIHYDSLTYEYVVETPMILLLDFLLDVGYCFGLF
jgi:hypothetical protein